MTKAIEKAFSDEHLSLKAFQVLCDNSFDSLVITDATRQTKILYANKAFKKLTGYDPAEVVGKTPKILQGAGTDKTVIRRLVKALQNDGRFEGKAINYRKDGTPFIMHWRVVPIKVGAKTKAWIAIQRQTFGL